MIKHDFRNDLIQNINLFSTMNTHKVIFGRDIIEIDSSILTVYTEFEFNLIQNVDLKFLVFKVKFNLSPRKRFQNLIKF